MLSVVLIPLLPLLAVLINGIFGRKYLKESSHYFAVGSVAISFVLSVSLLVRMLSGEPPITVNLYSWIFGGGFDVHIGFLIDPLSSVMLMVVTGVGLLIHIYSIGYMHGDPGYYRFFTYLNLFMVSMLLLVMGDNYLVLFIGWEGVGLCSYLLIAFWFEKESATKAGTKAFVVNRIGDAGFLIAIFLIAEQFGTLNYVEVFERAPELSTGMATAIALCLFIGAIGKSAQLPLYTWLPDAMEGPTPVSALIHAATMVTAGVYMVVRNQAIYDLAPIAMTVVAVTGGATAIFAATIGLVQTDIKRVLAYSTVSQLGYMFLGCGVGAYAAAIFHLVTHAFFKALLFLGSGSVIHALGGEQDIRKMGGLKAEIPVTAATFLIGTIAIAGLPPLAGFWSKDEILGMAFKGGHQALWLVGMTGAFLTSFYMFRLFYLTFTGTTRMTPEAARHVHESPAAMTVPLMTRPHDSAPMVAKLRDSEAVYCGDCLSKDRADDRALATARPRARPAPIVAVGRVAPGLSARRRLAARLPRAGRRGRRRGGAPRLRSGRCGVDGRIGPDRAGGVVDGVHDVRPQAGTGARDGGALSRCVHAALE